MASAPCCMRFPLLDNCAWKCWGPCVSLSLRCQQPKCLCLIDRANKCCHFSHCPPLLLFSCLSPFVKGEFCWDSKNINKHYLSITPSERNSRSLMYHNWFCTTFLVLYLSLHLKYYHVLGTLVFLGMKMSMVEMYPHSFPHPSPFCLHYCFNNFKPCMEWWLNG